jgi:hypothetical protein
VISHTKVNYGETESTYGMHFLREPLECEDHGVTVVDADPGWEGPNTNTATRTTRRCTCSLTAKRR